MKIRDLENAIKVLDEPNDLYEVTCYLSKAECLWLISQANFAEVDHGTIISQMISTYLERK